MVLPIQWPPTVPILGPPIQIAKSLNRASYLLGTLSHRPASLTRGRHRLLNFQWASPGSALPPRIYRVGKRQTQKERDTRQFLKSDKCQMSAQIYVSNGWKLESRRRVNRQPTRQAHPKHVIKKGTVGPQEISYWAWGTDCCSTWGHLSKF